MTTRNSKSQEVEYIHPPMSTGSPKERHGPSHGAELGEGMARQVGRNGHAS